VTIPDELMKRVDDALDGVIERDPVRTAAESPNDRPS
jgi:hypothetical protein